MEFQFKELCPNCGGTIDSNRLNMGLPCEVCLPSFTEKMKEGALSKIDLRNKNLNEIEEMCQKVLKTKMWALQRFWARRFLEGESFNLTAPTGSGKTTMQIILSLYAAFRSQKRCLILLPTSLLVHQVNQKLSEFKKILGLEIETAFYHSMLSQKEKKEQLKKIKQAKVILTTHLSLIKRKEINSQKVDIVFVDDIDSFLKSGKSIVFVFQMLKLPKPLKRIISKIYNKEIEIQKALQKIERLKERLKFEGQIIVSGATTRGKKTKSIILLTRIFGFGLGGKINFGRKILDCYLKPEKSLKESVAEIVKKIGKGGLIFVPSDKGKEFAQDLENYLEKNGVRAKTFINQNKKYFEMFEKGELDCLVGMVTPKSPLVRGIDLPEIIRYAVFAGVPKFLIRINIEEFHPTKWLMLLNTISHALKEDYKREFEILTQKLTKIKNLNKDQLKAVREALRENKNLEGFLEYAKKIGFLTIEFFKKILKDKDIIEALKKSPTISFGFAENEYYFLVVDEVSYIQASGRTSRLYIGGLTKGLSVVVVDDEKAFNSLVK
ncbi:DEAD/DEAH box helicase, partial [Candidatus Parcubacteria bacterium]|nr:DEAD/DEAH box helicase [Candidatus Parcubacteria bacterium]